MPTEILEQLRHYGADIDGVLDRFCGNEPLYLQCLKDFFSDEKLAQLEEAILRQDDTAAFQAAHALKGLSANLGLTPYFAAISKLTESLRRKEDARLPAEYAAVSEQLQALRHLLSDSL